MSENNRFVLGYELGEQYSQISYCGLGEGVSPETISTINGGTQYNIPTVLCKRHGVNQWFYGREALKQASEGNGVLVRDLTTLAMAGAPVEVDGDEFDPVSLLALFVKRSLAIVNMSIPIKMVETLVFTVESMNPIMLRVLNEISGKLNLGIPNIFFQTFTESYYYYILNQSRDIWAYSALAFRMHEEGVTIYKLDCNQNTKPKVVFIDEDTTNEIKLTAEIMTRLSEEETAADMDARFLRLLKRVLADKTVSSVFLLGDGSYGDWMKDSTAYLCQGRRVFQGNNLFSRGACYAAKEKTIPGELTSGYIFLGRDKLRENIGMKVIRKGEESYYAVLDAGNNWFELKTEFEVILDKNDYLAFASLPLDGSAPRNLLMDLSEFPERPPKTTRAQIKAEMIRENVLAIEVRDMGFGELFPATYQMVRKEFFLGPDWQELEKKASNPSEDAMQDEAVEDAVDVIDGEQME